MAVTTFDSTLAAIEEAVVTLVRAKRPADLVSLQGLGTRGVVLPGDMRFIDRSRLAGIAAVRGGAGGGL